MPAIFSDPYVQRIIAIAVLACLVAIAYYIAARLRNAHKEKELTPEELLPIFSALRDSGKMTEEEFQVIKMHLGQLIQQGVRWGGEDAKVDQISQIMAMASSKQLSKSDFEEELLKEKETLNIGKRGESEENTIQG